MKTLVQCVIIGIMALFIGCTGMQLDYANSKFKCRNLGSLLKYGDNYRTYKWSNGSSVEYYAAGDKVKGLFILPPKGGIAQFVNLTLVAYFATKDCRIVAKGYQTWSQSDNIRYGQIPFEIDIPESDQELTKIAFTYRGTYI